MKLHIGGKEKKDGWKILNIQKNDGVDFVGDMSDLSQFDSSTVDEIYASHVFEHVPQDKIKITLEGIYRVLRENGKFYVSVPDIEVLFHSFRSPQIDKKIRVHILRMIYGGQIDENDFHYFGYNFELLSDYLKDAGFSKVEKVKSFNLFNDTSEYKPYGFPISLNVISQK